jgi:hypothetical protein
VNQELCHVFLGIPWKLAKQPMERPFSNNGAGFRVWSGFARSGRTDAKRVGRRRVRDLWGGRLHVDK